MKDSMDSTVSDKYDPVSTLIDLKNQEFPFFDKSEYLDITLSDVIDVK